MSNCLFVIMKKYFVIVLMCSIVFSLSFLLVGCSSDVDNNDFWEEIMEESGYEVATLAGGCFWCIEAAFDGGDGIISATSGYTGGDASTASYYEVVGGDTGHRESVRITFDPAIVSYEEVLNIFWRQIDPTDSGGQFADRGNQYTTAIYYHNEAQKEIALKTTKEQEESKRFGDSAFVTEILAVGAFYEAEEEHQNYAQKRTTRYKLYEEGSGRAGFLRGIWNSEK